MANPSCTCGTCRKCKRRYDMQRCRARKKSLNQRMPWPRYDGWSFAEICRVAGFRINLGSTLAGGASFCIRKARGSCSHDNDTSDNG